MLPKINRIKKKNDFDFIFKNAKSFKNKFFIFKAIKNKAPLNRFAFVVSLRVAQSAVARNRLRRRMSAVIKNYSGIDGKGMDLVLIALPGSAEKNFSEIKKAILEGLEKIDC